MKTFYYWLSYAAQVGSYFGFVLLVCYLFLSVRTVISIVQFRLKGFFWRDAWAMSRGPPPQYPYTRAIQESRPEAVQMNDLAPRYAPDPLPPANSRSPTVSNPVVVTPTPPAPPVQPAHPISSGPFLYSPADKYTPLDPLLVSRSRN